LVSGKAKVHLNIDSGVTMRKMGRYCKAYEVSRFGEFTDWKGKLENARKEKQQVAGGEVEMARPLVNDSYLYLQEDYTVTDGIFLGENVIFDDVSPEWIDFCTNTLKFEVPAYHSTKSA
jgi:hypothetical protein